MYLFLEVMIRGLVDAQGNRKFLEPKASKGSFIQLSILNILSISNI